MNYRKIHTNNLKFAFNCISVETQIHIFEECTPILHRMKVVKYIELNKYMDPYKTNVK